MQNFITDTQELTGVAGHFVQQMTLSDGIWSIVAHGWVFWDVNGTFGTGTCSSVLHLLCDAVFGRHMEFGLLTPTKIELMFDALSTGATPRAEQAWRVDGIPTHTV